MNPGLQAQGYGELLELVIFQVGPLACGMDIREIMEIKRIGRITPVPRSSESVRGVINLRGQIATLLCLRELFGFEPVGNGEKVNLHAVFVSDGFETVGLLVDTVDDAIETQRASVQPPPANIEGVRGQLFKGILPEPERLVCLIDCQKILESGIG